MRRRRRSDFHSSFRHHSLRTPVTEGETNTNIHRAIQSANQMFVHNSFHSLCKTRPSKARPPRQSRSPLSCPRSQAKAYTRVVLPIHPRARAFPLSIPLHPSPQHTTAHHSHTSPHPQRMYCQFSPREEAGRRKKKRKKKKPKKTNGHLSATRGIIVFLAKPTPIPTPTPTPTPTPATRLPTHAEHDS